jgi:hypothetical protein
VYVLCDASAEALIPMVLQPLFRCSFGEGGFSRVHLFKVKVVYTLSRLSEDTSLKITFRYTSLIIIINLNKKYYAQSNNHSYLL